MVVRGYVNGIENSERGWRVKLQLYPGVDAAAEDRLHAGGDPCVYLRLPCSEGEARQWGAVAGARIELTLALAMDISADEPGDDEPGSLAWLDRHAGERDADGKVVR